MYEAFYGFKRQPFSNIPDPDLLFMSNQHKRALSLLEYAIASRAGFCVVTGDVGAGKTTLVRRVLKNVHKGLEVGLVSNTQCESFEEFLQWIMLAFNLEYRGKEKVELYDTFVQFLIQRFSQGRPVTLIIDEAQHLGPRYLEQLRMLSNVNTEKGQVLQTILVGQPELWDLLRQPQLSQFAQRISYDYFLGPLQTADEVGEYIRHRVRVSGGSETLFHRDTYELIRSSTQGVPRLINLVCDTALVYGYGNDQKTIGTAMIAAVLKDKEMGFASVGQRTQASPQHTAPRDPCSRPQRAVHETLHHRTCHGQHRQQTQDVKAAALVAYSRSLHNAYTNRQEDAAS